MSDLIVKVCKIDEIKPIEKADNLEIAMVGGWSVVVKKGEFKVQDRAIYFPPETMLPEYVARSLGIYKYLKGSDVSNKRIGQIRLRGEASLGLLIPIDPTWEEKAQWEIDKNCIDFFSCRKYFPPPVQVHGANVGQICRDHPLFIHYTDIQNMRHYPHAFTDGEEVVITEKLHGQNLRAGIVNSEFMFGSHTHQRKRPEAIKVPWYKRFIFGKKRPDVPMPEASCPFWYVYTIDSVRNLLTELGAKHKVVILFGESYGKIQKGFNYDCPKEQRATFRAFDLYIDGKYLDFDEFKNTCDTYGVPTVPILARIPYSLDAVKQWSEGKTTIGESPMREGVVVKPVKERYSNDIDRGGRLVLKYVSDTYLLSKNHEEGDTTDV